MQNNLPKKRDTKFELQAVKLILKHDDKEIN